MDVVEALVRCGGVADAAALTAMTSRRRLRTAVAAGSVVRLASGRYAVPEVDEGRRAAARVHGYASHLSAALLHGWEVKQRPIRPMVIVPRGRRVGASRSRGIDLVVRTIEADEVWQDRTRAGRTVIDCARDLAFDAALAVADSALRHGHVGAEELHHLAVVSPRTGRGRCLRVAELASPLAANPFESVLRAIAADVPGLDLEPQVVIDEDGFTARPDLVDRERRIVVEADSFAFHGTRAALVRDCVRYNALVLRGWLVLRFSWEHVMHDPDYVRRCLEEAVLGRPHRPTVRRSQAQKSAWGAEL
ncbi:hypothetical protein ASG49_10170 [Marmoricola sp. Leaf446]|uniref:DUF559 domain-containing protein n=1 Tax=Marmoricola sp. Leaf446 TaxID=1736379 RepID=UPI0006FAC581|nr:DUF559 domain-containing protein [Marmoricola sp. Leaf446]KQT92283.1 hypothetical protein ASG49_10170 [Marmoricola sp. Leaf446]